MVLHGVLQSETETTIIFFNVASEKGFVKWLVKEIVTVTFSEGADELKLEFAIFLYGLESEY